MAVETRLEMFVWLHNTTLTLQTFCNLRIKLILNFKFQGEINLNELQ